MKHIIGHTQQRETLKKLWADNRVPSTALFHGPKCIGKSLVAEEMARSLLCEKSEVFGGCSDCPACRLLEAGNHPDYHRIQVEDKENFSLQVLKDLLYSLALRPYLGKGRVIVLDGSEYLSTAASNTLLKSLEEPRPNTHFILLSSSPSRIPPTVLSRCQAFFFGKLSPSDLAEVISSLPDISAEERHLLGEIADGSLEPLSLLRENKEELSAVREILMKSFQGDITFALLALKDYKEREDALRFLNILRFCARALLLTKKDRDSMGRLGTLLENLMSAEWMIRDRNLNTSQVLQTLFLIFGRSPFPIFTNDDSLLDRIIVT
jgi:DNA polymerase III subunit delta'